MTELKPCPNCGSNAKLVYDRRKDKYRYECDGDCWTQTKKHNSEEEARAEWNALERERHNELKPCPFCGGKATYGRCMTYTAEGWCVKCTKCGARSVPIYENLPTMTSGGLDETTRYNTEEAKRKTAEKWNRRANDA